MNRIGRIPREPVIEIEGEGVALAGVDFDQAPWPHPLEEKFWSQVAKFDSCWLWTGPLRDRVSGYGDFCTGSRGKTTHRPAHRFAFELANGPIPAGLYVCHRCDVRLCVNPAHLFLGTHGDNQADKAEKGRSYCPKGELAPAAKLTTEKVREIKARLAEGEQGLALAREFGVTPGAISCIRVGKSWRHV